MSEHEWEKRTAGPSLAPIAARSFKPYDEMYKVVDFLNKNLKDRNLMFGLTKDKETGLMTVSIYEV